MTPPNDDRSLLICYNLTREITRETIYFRAKCPAAYFLSASCQPDEVSQLLKSIFTIEVSIKLEITQRYIIVTNPVITDDQQYFDESLLTTL